MQKVLSLLLVALMAATALAAPFKTLAKRGSFAVPVRGRYRDGKQIVPIEEMQRIFNKYNWNLNLAARQVDDINLGSALGGLGGVFGSNNPSQAGNSNPEGIFGGNLGGELGAGSIASGVLSAVDPLITNVPFATPFTISTADATTESNTATTLGNGQSQSSTSSAATSFTNSSTMTTMTTMTTQTTMAASTTSAAAASAADGSETSEVTASPEANDAEYLAPVTIGGQTLHLDFDTGSADLWVFSTELSSSDIGSHTAFDKSKSDTWSDYDGATWKITYGDGSGASGNVGYDNVAIGDATATSQAVELATQVSQQFVSDTDNDGLLGLAFSNINTVTPKKQKTWFDTIKDDLEKPVFTADLEKDASGTYEFGKIDDSKYTGDIHYTKVDSGDGFWKFDSKTYTVGGDSKSCTTCSAAIADTGTSLLLVDDDVAAAYYSQVKGAKNSASQGGYVYPCDATLPDFGIAIGDYIANLKGADLTYASINSNTCFGGVQGNSGSGMQIYGDVFFKQYFAIFDGGNVQFGVASKP